MQLRPYQKEAVDSILEEWDRGVMKTLLVLPTGCGKTVVFAKVAEAVVGKGGRVLVLAHRAELLEQAADKIEKVTGLGCAVEKAEQTAEGTWYNITVGSVQSFNPSRLERISPNTYSHIIIDEAHHTLAATYMRVLSHFCESKVLGVTATADRGDKRELGSVFQTLAFEMSLPRAVHFPRSYHSYFPVASFGKIGTDHDSSLRAWSRSPMAMMPFWGSADGFGSIFMRPRRL